MEVKGEGKKRKTPDARTRGVTGVAQVGDILYERRGDAVHAYKMDAD